MDIEEAQLIERERENLEEVQQREGRENIEESQLREGEERTLRRIWCLSLCHGDH